MDAGLARSQQSQWEAKIAHQVVCVGLKCQALESLPCSVIAWGLQGEAWFRFRSWDIAPGDCHLTVSLERELGECASLAPTTPESLFSSLAVHLRKSAYVVPNYSCHLLNTYQVAYTSNPVSQIILPTTSRVEKD